MKPRMWRRWWKEPKVQEVRGLSWRPGPDFRILFFFLHPLPSVRLSPLCASLSEREHSGKVPDQFAFFRGGSPLPGSIVPSPAGRKEKKKIFFLSSRNPNRHLFSPLLFLLPSRSSGLVSGAHQQLSGHRPVNPLTVVRRLIVSFA